MLLLDHVRHQDASSGDEVTSVRKSTEYHKHVEPAPTLKYGVINDPLHDHGVEGAVHNTQEYMARIRKKQQKAVKAYIGKEVELCSDRTAKGW